MQPDTMDLEEARRVLSEHFSKPIDEVETDELEELYNTSMRESKEAAYTEPHEELTRALNLVLMNRRNDDSGE